MWNKYRALLWPLIGGLVMVLLQSYSAANASGGVDAGEWVTVVIQGFTLVNIWLVANVPGWEKAKALMAGVMLVLNMLVTLVVGGLDLNEIIQLALAFFGAAGVFVMPGPVTQVSLQPDRGTLS